MSTDFAEPGVRATDMRGESLEVRSLWSTAAYDAVRPGFYSLEYTAQDRSGFESKRFREVGEYNKLMRFNVSTHSFLTRTGPAWPP